MIKTTNQYWDCECMLLYIHPSYEEGCPECHAKKENSPDSRIDEVLAEGLKIKDTSHATN